MSMVLWRLFVTTMKVSDSKLLYQRYRQIEAEYHKKNLSNNSFHPECGITNSEIQDFIDFLENTVPLTMYDIRYKAFKLAIKYSFSIDSFWSFIQVKRGVWKQIKEK